MSKKDFDNAGGDKDKLNLPGHVPDENPPLWQYILLLLVFVFFVLGVIWVLLEILFPAIARLAWLSSFTL